MRRLTTQARPRVVRAQKITHKLSSGHLRGHQVGRLTTEQLEDAKEGLLRERERAKYDEVLSRQLANDIKEIDAERERRWANLTA